MNLKVRVDHLLLGIGAAVLLIGGLLSWRALRPEPENVELEQGLEQLRGKPAKASPRFLRPRGSFAEERPRSGEGWADPQLPSHAGDPGEPDAKQAVDDFQAVLTELEAVLDEQRRLTQRERNELYNRATGSFKALSAWTDPSDANERALIDDAYAQMMALLRELDIEPSRHDPDYHPLRR